MASKHLLVGAIDFGTTYSGWACSFRHEFETNATIATVNQWHCGSSTLTTEKTPTCVLVQPDGKTLEAFGYEAENKYKDLVDKDEHYGFFYFIKFKMMLNTKLRERLNRNMTLEDVMGQSLPAIDVFSMAIKFLKDDMLQTVNSRLLSALNDTDVFWVLTVPAIWTDDAKQFMREAANKAGIPNKQLTIALEPEAASIYCRNISVEAKVDESDVEVATFKAGTRYLVLDAGGGTIDITVHEVEKSGGIKEVHAACGGGWGGTMVDKAFENMLIDICTKEVYKKFKNEETEDWLDIWRDFEVKKKYVKYTGSPRIYLKIPLSLINMYNSLKHTSLSDDLKKSRFSGDISISPDKMNFSEEVFKSLFKSPIEKTIGCVDGVMKDQHIDAILMVGGFTESPMLQHAVKSTFPSVQVLIPKDASSAILRGALIFGHSPESVTERILKYTYGIRISRPFEEGRHPESMRIQTDTGDRCEGIFSKHVEKDQTVEVGKPQVTKSYFPVNWDQRSLDFHMYASELKTPEYTDKDCKYLGQMTVQLTNTEGDLSREVLVSMTFSGTEIVVTAKDKKTGEETDAAIDFLG